MKKSERGALPKARGRRPVQLANLLQQLVAQFFERELEWQTGVLVTVTGVTVTADLSEARVGVSVLPFASGKEILERVQKKAFFLQKHVNSVVTSYRVPRLVFLLDGTAERTGKILGILDSLDLKG